MTEKPLYERDPAAWQAELAEGNATQPRKRVSADLLIRDGHGRVLLVDPVYKPDWDIPGGMVEANEPPHTAAQREHGPWDDLLAFIFDGGQLSPAELSALSLRDGELSAAEFCEIAQARQRLRPYVFTRLQAALTAAEEGTTQYLVNGESAAH